MDRQVVASPCCHRPVSSYRTSTLTHSSRCPGCHTLWVSHCNKSSERVWDGAVKNEPFLEALAARRQKQSLQILDQFALPLQSGPVLDYACGQGVFLSDALLTGVDAYGCDLRADVHRDRGIDEHRFFLLSQPWGWPSSDLQFKTLVLLDVFEHIDEPVDFLKMLSEKGVKNVVIKVPLVTGPCGLVARLASKFKKTGLMDSLLLAGEASPHVVFYSSKGLIALFDKCGFEYQKSLTIAEVGAELVERIRIGGNMRNVFPLRLGLKSGGSVLEGLSRVWSDSAVFWFRQE